LPIPKGIGKIPEQRRIIRGGLGPPEGGNRKKREEATSTTTWVSTNGVGACRFCFAQNLVRKKNTNGEEA